MDYLKGLVNLKELAVEDATITDDGLKVVRSFPRLEILDVLRDQNISDAGLAALAGLVNLRQLSLRGTPINGSGLAHLSGCASSNTSISTRPRSTTGAWKTSRT